MRVSEMARASMKSTFYPIKKNAGPKQADGSRPQVEHVNLFEDPYLDITDKSPSEWQKIVPVDDEVAEKLRDLIKEDFVKRNGMCGEGGQADAQANIIKDYIATLPGGQKLSAIYSCEQIAYQEADRLSAAIRKENPQWQYGQPFDTGILNDNRLKGLDILV